MLKIEKKKELELETEKTSSSLIVRSEEKKLSGLDDLWEHIKEAYIKELEDRKDKELQERINSFAGETIGVILEAFLENLAAIDETLSKKEKEKKRKEFIKKKNQLEKYLKKNQLENKIKLYRENYDRKRVEDNDVEYIKIALNDKVEKLLRIRSEIKKLEDFEEEELSNLKNDEERLDFIKSALKFILEVDKGNRKAEEELRNLEWNSEKDKLEQELESSKKTIEELKDQLKDAESKHDSLKRELDLIKEEEKRKEFKETINRAERAEEEAEEWKKKFTDISSQVARSKGVNVNIENKNENAVSASASSRAEVTNYLIEYEYVEKLAKEELDKFENSYQELEKLEPVNESSSNPQKLKKTILFLGAKQIFAATRGDTINALIKVYKDSVKSGEKYDKFIRISSYISEFRGIVSIFPSGGIVVDALEKGIPAITSLLKDRSFAKHDKKFENYLIKDEKSLTLLQETYQSLDNSLQGDQRSKLGSVLSRLFNYNKDLLDKNSIFEISKEGEVDLRKSKGLNVEDMEKVIDSLDEHFKKFVKEFKEEAGKYAKEVEKAFSEGDGSHLQISLNQLLVELLIRVKKDNLKSLVTHAKKELESKGNSDDKEKRKQALDLFFNNIPSKHEEFIERLEIIKDNWKKRMSEQEVEVIWRTNNELKQLQDQLKSLKEQQAQMEISSK